MIINALKNHEYKLCYHGLEGFKICWSYILHIGTQHALACKGPPRKNKFIQVKSP